MTAPDLLEPTASRRRDLTFWSTLLLIVSADIVTKRWAEQALTMHLPEEAVGHWLRWTLTYNTGAAMNLSLGDASRAVFSGIALLMVGYLFYLYRQAQPGERAAPFALGLIAAGALGNLLDRLRHTKGVVDFIDVGTASWRFWTFNVADMGVTVGALLLALLMWREDRTASSVEESAGETSPTPRPES